MNFNRELKKLYEKETELNCAVGSVLRKIQSVSESEMFLDYVPSDGWCIGSEITGQSLYMKLDVVIKIIEDTGEFTDMDWFPFN